MTIEQDALDVLARTAWGEARGEQRAGMTAVINVVLNRVKANRWPNDVMSVCQQALQFSCWNANDPNRAKLLAVNANDPVFKVALELSQIALDGNLTDTTNGADHYHEQSIHPYWATGQIPVAHIGRHKFYKLT